MRLAQIARKVGMTPTDIKRFLESEFELSIGKEPNYKLDDTQVNAVLEKFPVEEEVVIEAVKKQAEPEAVVEEEPVIIAAAEEEEVIEAEIDSADEIEEDEEEEEITIELEEFEAVVESAEAIEEEVSNETADSRVEINYDDEGEPINEAPSSFKEVEVNLDAEIIQAPKIKLDGLKVLGKIELPQDKIVLEAEKTEAEIQADEDDEIAALEAAMMSQAQDVKAAKVITREAKATVENINADEEEYSEYKDTKGIYHYSHSQKENRAKAIVSIELKQKAFAAKEKKKRYYETIMNEKKAKASSSNSKEIVPNQKPKPKKVKTPEPAAPKGLWSRFVHWLND